MVLLQLYFQREEVRKADEASGWASSSPSLQTKQLCFYSDLNIGIKEGVILNYYYFEERKDGWIERKVGRSVDRCLNR